MPLAGPPTLGLQGIEPTISIFIVKRAVFFCIRLAAMAASIPA